MPTYDTAGEVSFYDPSFPAWFRLRFDLETARVIHRRRPRIS